MGRKSVYEVGNFFGGLEVVEIMPSVGSGNAVKLRCICHYCNTETIKSGGSIKRRNSCGCQQHESSTWKSIGAKNKPWQLQSGQSARNSLKYQYERGAKKRNLKFDLTEEDFDMLVTGDCVYCGSQTPATQKGQGKTSGDFYYTGIDRVDSNEGYVKYNCVSCCWLCNNMKGKLDAETFMKHIQKIYNQNKGKNNDT